LDNSNSNGGILGLNGRVNGGILGLNGRVAARRGPDDGAARLEKIAILGAKNHLPVPLYGFFFPDPDIHLPFMNHEDDQTRSDSYSGSIDVSLLYEIRGFAMGILT
jgi:hypothetical protein